MMIVIMIKLLEGLVAFKSLMTGFVQAVWEQLYLMATNCNIWELVDKNI